MDPRSPLVVSTHELGRRPGSTKRLRTVLPAPADLGTELVGVEAGSDLALDLRLEAVMEGVLVSGTVSGVVVGECGRCLGPIREPLTADLLELFIYPERAFPEEEPEDLPEIVGDFLDLEPSLRDALVTALPFQPLCRPDCPGLCPECGERLADVVGPHVHERVDPRWEALLALAEAPVEDRAERS